MLRPFLMMNFQAWFDDFCNNYIDTSDGLKDIRSYEKNRRNLKNVFYQKTNTDNEYWQRGFVENCTENPEKSLQYCQELASDLAKQNKILLSTTISPALNAFNPDYFLSIDWYDIKFINCFCGTNYGKQLIDYPLVNETGKELIKSLEEIMQRDGLPVLRSSDMFKMFVHWLINTKQTNLSRFFYTGIDKEILDTWLRILNRKGQIILQGPPGTGKSYIAEKLAKYLTANTDSFYELIQFHPAYTYEDFIQGIRPQSENGKLTYPMVPGRFLQFCQKAELYEGVCVLIIDEINRANLTQVFGELMYLLEYRDQTITLAGSNTLFKIPKNVRIIGTMNTADRSIALVDYALRRRFAFIQIDPDYDALETYCYDLNVDKLIEIIKKINQTINDRHYYLGTSFFMVDDLNEHLEDIWKMEIEPYLEEYFFNQPDKVNEFRWENIVNDLYIEKSIDFT